MHTYTKFAYSFKYINTAHKYTHIIAHTCLDICTHTFIFIYIFSGFYVTCGVKIELASAELT